MQMLYACDNVRTLEYGAKLNTPPMKAFRAPGFVEGTFGLECLLDELAAKLEIDPLELRKRNYAHSDRRAAVLVEEPDGVLRARREALGAPRRGACAQRRDVEARRRPRVAGLVRRRRPALVRVGPARLRRARAGRHRDAGHRHRLEDRDAADRRGGARPADRPRRGLRRRHVARAVRVDLRRLVDDPVDGPGRSRGGRRRGAAGDRDRRAALRQGGAHALAEGRQRHLLRRRLVAARGGRRRARRRRRSSARARAARTRPACRC